ncbi:MAG: ROK family transcriptional regulator [Bacteroidales bacterium]|nr:ROK family transcriptional regulator [Bacteroidales bacterium]
MSKGFLNNTEDKNYQSKKEILRTCIRHSHCSIAELSKTLGISVPTVTKLVSELIDDGFLQDEGKIGTSGGRRPSIFGLNPTAGYFLGIDVARQHFHIAVSDFKGEIKLFIQDIEFVLEANADSFRNMCILIKKEVESADIDWNMVLGVGISLSGRVNPEKGFSLTYFVSDDIPLKDLFQKELGVPVTIENDSRAMAYGEYMNLGKDANPNMLFINLSWGLGMGIIVNGELYYGTSGFSGEIGHFPLLDNDVICRCGKIGCLETGASGSALKSWILARLEEGRQSSLSKLDDIRLHNILEAIEAGDVLAIEGIGQIGETLGRGIAGLINIFNPGLVIIGGRLIVGRDYLMLPIKTAVNRLSLSKVSADTKLRFSTLERRAASIGNCLLSRGKILGLL